MEKQLINLLLKKEFYSKNKSKVGKTVFTNGVGSFYDTIKKAHDKYPDTDFAQDANYKLDLIQDLLAAKESLEKEDSPAVIVEEIVPKKAGRPQGSTIEKNQSRITFSGGYHFDLNNTTIQQDQTVWAGSTSDDTFRPPNAI